MSVCMVKSHTSLTELVAVRQLDKYPVLESYLAGKFKEEKIKYDSMHVSLGPNGSFYINSSVGQHQNGLDPKLQKELDGRLTPEGLWPWDPAQVALGVEGSYVLVGKKGDIMWDLKGHYASLETKLQEAKLGVKVGESTVSCAFIGSHS